MESDFFKNRNKLVFGSREYYKHKNIDKRYGGGVSRRLFVAHIFSAYSAIKYMIKEFDQKWLRESFYLYFCIGIKFDYTNKNNNK